MKDLFNNMRQEEKDAIRGQHTGGKKITIENFSNMVNKKLGVVNLFEQSDQIMDDKTCTLDFTASILQEWVKGILEKGLVLMKGSGRSEKLAEVKTMIKLIQCELCIKSDGIYGPNTEKAVRDFQKKHGLTIDGIVGDETLGKLIAQYGKNCGGLKDKPILPDGEDEECEEGDEDCVEDNGGEVQNNCLDKLGKSIGVDLTPQGGDIRLWMNVKITFYGNNRFFINGKEGEIKGDWKCIDGYPSVRYPGTGIYAKLGL